MPDAKQKSGGSDIHAGHRQRLRNRFLAEGIDNFEDHVVLELLLFYSIPQRDTNEIAHRLLAEFGSLAAVFDAPPEELCKVNGINIHSATLIRLCSQLCRKYLMSKTPIDMKLKNTDGIDRQLRPYFVGCTEEIVVLLCLDNRRQILYEGIIHRGSVNSTEVSIRKIMQLALRHNATGVVIAHNHPKGTALPSQDDLETTARLGDALKSVGITLIDHFIYDEIDGLSFYESEFL